MKLDISNLKVFIHHEGYALKILMPDGSGNYLHGENHGDVNETLIVRELILDQKIEQQELRISEDDEYFRLELNLSDINGDNHFFNSRKLNLNDAVFEREQLLI